MRLFAAAVTVLAACASATRDEARLAEPAPRAVPREGVWQLTWHGAPIGLAWESERDGTFVRRERVIVRRGDAIVVSELEIDVARGPAGTPVAVTVARWGDGPALAGRARATRDGWAVEVDGEPAATLPPALPFELAVRDAHARGGFEGRVLLAGWGFAVAQLSLAPADPGDDGAWLARLTVGDRVATARIRYDRDGSVREIAGGDGVLARAAAPGEARWPPVTDPIEVVGGSAIQLDGAGGVGAALAGVRFPDATASPPPTLPGQDVRADGGAGWHVRFTRDDDIPGELAALVSRVADDVADDLGATTTTTGAALAATRGDCTTHALRFAALAAQRGIPVRLVTGLRLDGDTLVRHRWNLAWTGERWIAVDPTWDEAPATSVIGLAAHGPRAADLAAADAMVFDGLGARAIALP